MSFDVGHGWHTTDVDGIMVFERSGNGMITVRDV